MAASNDNRARGCETNPFFLEAFRESADLDEREREWHIAIAHAGQGTPPLRFPAYEALYLVNVYAHKLVDLLDDICNRFGIGREGREYHQSLLQYVRASVSQDITEQMSGIELTEEWLFDRLRKKEEQAFRDPDDIYLAVRDREAERVTQGLPPRIRFVDRETGAAAEPTDIS